MLLESSAVKSDWSGLFGRRSSSLIDERPFEVRRVIGAIVKAVIRVLNWLWKMEQTVDREEDVANSNGKISELRSTTPP